MKYSYIYMVLLMFILACEEEGPGESRSLVVEGYLYAGTSSQQIQLSFPGQLGINNEIVSEAKVKLLDDTLEYEFMHEGDGIYTYKAPDLSILPGVTYELDVEYKGQKINAKTTVPNSPLGLSADKDTLTINDFSSNAIMFSWKNDDFEYYSPFVESITIDADSLFNQEVDLSNFSRPNTQSEVYVDLYQIKYIGQNNFILYGVTAEYTNLYDVTDQESQLLQPGNIQGALGIFTSFSSDTLQFYVKRF